MVDLSSSQTSLVKLTQIYQNFFLFSSKAMKRSICVSLEERKINNWLKNKRLNDINDEQKLKKIMNRQRFETLPKA